MKSKSLKVATTFCIFFISFFIHSNVSLAFDDLTTHPALTDEVVDFYNLFSEQKITSEEKETIISGAMSEDTPPRWINHFYDPIRNIGWTGRNTGIWPTSFMRYFSGAVLSSTYPVSSLNWLHNQELQTYYKMYKGNQTWERAVYEYINGNKQESLRALGYILHLIEDAAVPDHTRDDPHAHDLRWATGDYGSPLEEYAKRFTRDNFNIADELKNSGYKPIVLNNVDDYLVSLAKYSNGYFFSKDTINDPIYANPKIVREDDDFGYGMDKDGKRFELVKIAKRKIRIGDNFEEIKEYFLLENKGEEIVIPKYFSRLSREAIINGAGVVDLFFKETEAIKLGQKPAPKLFVEEDKSIVRRVITLDGGLGNISVAGEFFKGVNLGTTIYGAVSGAVADTVLAGIQLGVKTYSVVSGAVAESYNVASGAIVKTYDAASGAVTNIAGLVFQKSSRTLDTKDKNIGALAAAIGATDNINAADLPASNLANAAIDATIAIPAVIYEDRPLTKQAPSRSPLATRGDLDGAAVSASNSKLSKEYAIQPIQAIHNQSASSVSSAGGPNFVAPVYFSFFGGGGGVVSSSSDSANSSNPQGLPAGDQTGLTSSSSSLPASSSSAGSSSASSTPDTTPPAAPIIVAPSDFSQTFTNTDIIFSGTAETLNKLSASSTDKSADFNFATTTASLSGDWSLALSLAQGTTTIHFFATDSAGNISSSTSVALFIDSLAPSISSFAISQCQQSLSSDGCLVATTTANLIWDSSSGDIDYFELTKNGTVSTTTASSANLTLADNSNNSFSLRAKDTAGNWSAAVATAAEVSLTPVIINELAWAGTSANYPADEWIELYNRTSKNINLNDFVLYSETDFTPFINLSGAIFAKGYYLLERTNDDTVSNIAADKIYTGGLLNDGENLALVYKPTGQATTTIDDVPYCFMRHWCGGSDSNYGSMERHSPDIAGADVANWGTNNSLIKNGKNAGGGNIIGTPRTRNYLNYLINKGQDISSALTLYASNSPYFVNGWQKFTADFLLTIEPGVVIKFNNDSGFYFTGGADISADGTADKPIVFTSFKDDTYAGDTNGDAASTSPTYGNWYGVRLDAPNSSSVFNNVIFRYGGWYYHSAWSDNRANLYLNGASAAITNSVFEYALSYGLKLVNSNSVISGSVFRYNNSEGDSSGLYALEGSPQINSNNFSNNKRGLHLLNLNSDSIINDNVFSSNADMAVYSSGKFGFLSNNAGSGNGVNGILIGDVISSAGATTTLAANSLPYIFNDFVTVAASSTLNIGSGVIMKGGTNGLNSGLVVRGNLIIAGTSSSDVIFGSALNQSKSSWGGIRLYPGSHSNISGATFEYANTALTYDDSSPINLSDVRFYENNLAVSGSVVQLVNPSTIEFISNAATTSPSGLW